MKGRWVFTASCLWPLKHSCGAVAEGNRPSLGPGQLHKAIVTQDCRPAAHPSKWGLSMPQPTGSPETLLKLRTPPLFSPAQPLPWAGLEAVRNRAKGTLSEVAQPTDFRTHLLNAWPPWHHLAPGTRLPRSHHHTARTVGQPGASPWCSSPATTWPSTCPRSLRDMSGRASCPSLLGPAGAWAKVLLLRISFNSCCPLLPGVNSAVFRDRGDHSTVPSSRLGSSFVASAVKASPMPAL